MRERGPFFYARIASSASAWEEGVGRESRKGLMRGDVGVLSADAATNLRAAIRRTRGP